MKSSNRPLSIGQLARRSGLTVRTLHHYEQLRLIDPPRRSPAGYRLYDLSAITQLHQALALKALGIPLKQIAAQRHQAIAPAELIQAQLQAARAQLKQQQALLERLEQIAAQLAGQAQTTSDSLLQAIEVTTMFEKYFTETQRAELKDRASELGPEIENAQRQWPVLIAEVESHRKAGTPPGDPRVQALAAQWFALVQQFTGGNPEIASSLSHMYRNEASVREQSGLSAELMAYVAAARAAAT